MNERGTGRSVLTCSCLSLTLVVALTCLFQFDMLYAQRYPELDDANKRTDLNFGAGISSMGSLSLFAGGAFIFNKNEIGAVVRTNSESRHSYNTGSFIWNKHYYADRLTEVMFFYGRNMQYQRSISTFRLGVGFINYIDYYTTSYETENWLTGLPQTAYSLHNVNNNSIGMLCEFEETLYLSRSFGIGARFFMNVNPELFVIGMTGTLRFLITQNTVSNTEEL